jgi:GNAT superfamily N-acetyltransferase
VSGSEGTVQVRNTRPEDFEQIVALCRAVYPGSIPWSAEQLASHVRLFPEGQFVAVDTADGRIVGMAASLIVLWDDYTMATSWRDFTDNGYFGNHDPGRGRTLYAAEVMVAPTSQGRGVGTRIYGAREALCRRLGLRRIRAGARLRGYARHAAEMSADEYAARVARGEIWDPTVSFQLRRGFRILGVVSGYLRQDPESLGFAAVIEWLNPAVAQPQDGAADDPRPPGSR